MSYIHLNGSEGDKILSGLSTDQDKERLYSFEISNTSIQLPAADAVVDDGDLLRQSSGGASTGVEVPSGQMQPAN